MGSGIAQLAASHSCQVNVIDSSPQALEKSKDKLQSVLGRLVEKEKLNRKKSEIIMENINWSSELNEISSSELVIEAIIEDMEVKQKLFSQMGVVVSKNCVLATNTSSLSVTKIASSCPNPSQVMGIHFFNPVPLMELVEIIPAAQTDCRAWLRKLSCPFR